MRPARACAATAARTSTAAVGMAAATAAGRSRRLHRDIAAAATKAIRSAHQMPCRDGRGRRVSPNIPIAVEPVGHTIGTGELAGHGIIVTSVVVVQSSCSIRPLSGIAHRRGRGADRGEGASAQTPQTPHVR